VVRGAALILEDGLSRQALSACRALAAAGWEVGIGAERPWGVAACSRFARYRHRIPAPNRDPDGFIEATSRAVLERGYEVVFGARDVDVLALSARRDEIPAEVPYPSHELVLSALDKERLYAAAERAGIAVPWTIGATDGEATRVEAPVMVKARVHASFEDGRGPPRFETQLATTTAEAVARVDEIQRLGGQPLLQEFQHEPRLVALAVVADENSRIVAQVQQEAGAIWPLDAGVSVRARTVTPDEELAAGGAGLVRELGWTGLAELQYTVPEDGLPRLIDFNGRFYGSMSLAVAAGVNLPAIWAAQATGRPVRFVREARPGVRYQWLWGDLRRSMDERRGLLETLRYSAGATQSVSSVRDPLPAVRHLQICLGRSARKLRR
jgi:predicted ATP-grasp superfamily ATP-dependent carboligase